MSEDLIEVQGTESPKHNENSDKQAKIANPVGHKGFFRCLGITCPLFALLKPKSNQQVRTQPNTFPTNKQHQVRVSADQDHHGGDEQIHVDEKPPIAPRIFVEAHIIVHVSNRVDMDQGANSRYHQHHGHRQRVNLESPVDLQIPDAYPLNELDDRTLMIGEKRNTQQNGNHKRQS